MVMSFHRSTSQLTIAFVAAFSLWTSPGARSAHPVSAAERQAGTPAAGFRAAAVKADITPQSSQWLLGYQARQSDGIHDRIYHRVLALSAGSTEFYLISSDLCLFSP